MKYIFLVLVSLSVFFSCGNVFSKSEKSKKKSVNKIVPDYSKIEISDDSLDVALFNLMLKSSQYSKEEIIKNVESLIKKGADPNVSIEYNYSVRKLGTYIPIVKNFYNNKYRHYTTNSTAFIEAVKTGNTEIVNKFTELKADINRPSKAGMYPLNAAILQNSEDIINLLIKNGADISFADLSMSKNIYLIEKLVKIGANPKTINIDFVIEDREGLEKIMSLRPDVNKFPLDYRVIFKNDTLLSYLLKNGLNNSARGRFPDECPLIYGAVRYGNKETVKFLKKSGINIFEDCDGINEKILFEVIRSEKTDILDYYLNEEKTDPNIKDWTGKSALIIAVDTDNDEIIKMLIKAGADIEYNGYFNKTPLMHAVQYKKYISAQTLINTGAKLNYKNSYGKTSLVTATEKKDFAMIKLLVENGADTKIKYKNMSLSEYAESENVPNMIVEYLEENE